MRCLKRMLYYYGVIKRQNPKYETRSTKQIQNPKRQIQNNDNPLALSLRAPQNMGSSFVVLSI